MSIYYLGVDVGTGSARAGLFSDTGKMLGTASKAIKMWKNDPAYVEQSSNNIWDSVCWSVKEALKKSGLKADDIKGIGFDATCSLVALDKDDNPVTLSPDGNEERNVIVWMDHRAIKEAELINSKKHKVLDFVGGIISPEMETPKLLWLKNNLNESWNNTARFFDLPDFLVYRATGSDTRSLCSTVCKWTYQGHVDSDNPDSVGAWDSSYFRLIGLGDLVDNNFEKIGQKIRPIGEKVDKGLSAEAAKGLGLIEGIPVGVSIIDAHAGGIGMLGAVLEDNTEIDDDTIYRRLALIGGTSSCHMALSVKSNFVPGVWGPYFSAMVPDLWLAEGGQSATGALVDHIIFSHKGSVELLKLSETQDKSVYQLLNERLDVLTESVDFMSKLTKSLHVLPYFHGNRSPRANPNLHGAITGLKLSSSLDELALIYYATIQSIAYGTRHIIEEMNNNGFELDTIFACGGGTKNPVFLQEHADITGCRIVLSAEHEAVLLGAAVLGAVASGNVSSVLDGMKKMNKADKVIYPTLGKISEYHNAKYKVFIKMYEDQVSYKQIMDY